MKRPFNPKHNSDPEPAGEPNSEFFGLNDPVRGLTMLYSPDVTNDTRVRDIADCLLETAVITPEQLNQIRQAEQNKHAPDIEQFIINSSFATPEDILMAKAELYGLEFQQITAEQIDKTVFEILELDYIRTNRTMPIAVKDDVLIVATSNPANVFAIDNVKRQTQRNVEVVVCTDSDIDSICDEFDESSFNYDVDEIISDMADIEVVKDMQEDVEDLEKSAGQSPVIKFVNYLLSNAVHEHASDIHIEPKNKYTKIRCRIDGVLFDSMQAPAKMHPAIVSRVKIMANLDISERRLPQDGKIAVIMGGRGIDLRISTLPTSHGEKVVIRILDSASIMHGLDQSGMEPKVLNAFKGQIAMPHGILLVTGPTGSGKSTTLYSALAQVDAQTMNVSTVEDPVEYDLELCNQVQANEKIGLTFATALRSLLRQDPDIIMVGEIRDQETARIAVQAALTGHLVLSTLHTNDAASSISRLVNIGVEPYLIAASLNTVLAQRLVRKICENCKEPYTASKGMLQQALAAGLVAEQLMHGKGCDQCRQSGYAGRVGIFELLIVDDNIKNLINTDTSSNSIQQALKQSGYPTLYEDGIEKVKKGLTTIEEVVRVTEVDHQPEEEKNFEDDQQSDMCEN